MPTSYKPPHISKAPMPIARARGVSAPPTAVADLRPDWTRWSRMVSVLLWQAVSLSLDLEPDAFRSSITHLGLDAAVQGGPADFRLRLVVAVNHLENGSLRAVKPAAEPRYSDVSLHQFAAWANSLSWQIPDSFPRGGRRSSKVPPPAAAERWFKAHIGNWALKGKIPSRDDDFEAACAEFRYSVPRPFVRDLRRQFAPDDWKAHGRRKSGAKKLAEKTGNK
jgi:hypothetical protein